MPVFMFWHVGKKVLSRHLGDAARSHHVDLLILAECGEPGQDIIRELNTDHPLQPYWEFMEGVSPLRFFTRLPSQSISSISDDGRASLRLIAPPLGPGILIAAAHLRSKLQADDFDQHFAATALNRLILWAEQKVGHKRTLVIGDLNMDPFDPGMMAANGLHAVMDKTIASKSRRVVQGESYEFFYNPMWSRMGDESHGPPGTYYYNQGGAAINRFWSTFDQVLLRPDLLKFYSSRQLHVLDEIQGVGLLKNNIIDKNMSDHLPIVIRLTTELGII